MTAYRNSLASVMLSNPYFSITDWQIAIAASRRFVSGSSRCSGSLSDTWVEVEVEVVCAF